MMSTRNSNPAWGTAGVGDPMSLSRLTNEVTALSTELVAQRSRYTRLELVDIRDNLNTLALIIARIKRLVSERIAVLTAGGFNGY